MLGDGTIGLIGVYILYSFPFQMVAEFDEDKIISLEK